MICEMTNEYLYLLKYRKLILGVQYAFQLTTRKSQYHRHKSYKIYEKDENFYQSFFIHKRENYDNS